jgi:hypothetical protein
MRSDYESELWAYLQTSGAAQDSLEPIPLLRLLRPKNPALRAHADRGSAAPAEQHRREGGMVAGFIALLLATPFREGLILSRRVSSAGERGAAAEGEGAENALGKVCFFFGQLRAAPKSCPF